MSDNETVVDTDDLNAFEDLFYGRAKPEEVVEEIEEVTDEIDEEDDSEAVDTDEAEDNDDEAESESDESDEDEAEEEAEKPRRNRKTAKERIQELNYEKKLAEQRYQDAMAEIDKLKVQKPSEEKAEVVEAQAPSPDALGKDGEPLYPLGEFDPAYIRALTRFTIDQETAKVEQELAHKRQQEASNAARAVAQEKWVNRLEEAEKELPDVREKIGQLGVMFDGIDQNYGQYLVDTVQSLENGPAILHDLADNPKEAKQIVNAGATVATLSLGRLDAQLAAERSRKEKTKAAAKVSKAPVPPKQAPKGSGGKFTVAGDTDDLDAFSREFFTKKR